MIKKYEFWWAKVKYEDCDNVETRPVLVIGNVAYVMALKATKTDRGNEGTELRLLYWKEAGLEVETSVRLSKVLKLTEADMVEKIGNLDDRDRLRLELRLAANV